MPVVQFEDARPQRWLVGGTMVTGSRLGPCDDGGLAR